MRTNLNAVLSSAILVFIFSLLSISAGHAFTNEYDHNPKPDFNFDPSAGHSFHKGGSQEVKITVRDHDQWYNTRPMDEQYDTITSVIFDGDSETPTATGDHFYEATFLVDTTTSGNKTKNVQAIDGATLTPGNSNDPEANEKTTYTYTVCPGCCMASDPTWTCDKPATTNTGPIPYAFCKWWLLYGWIHYVGNYNEKVEWAYPPGSSDWIGANCKTDTVSGCITVGANETWGSSGALQFPVDNLNLKVGVQESSTETGTVQVCPDGYCNKVKGHHVQTFVTITWNHTWEWPQNPNCNPPYAYGGGGFRWY